MDVRAKKEVSIYIPIVRGASNLATTQLLTRLPDVLVRASNTMSRCDSAASSSGGCSRTLCLGRHGSDDDPLYQAALAVEKEHELTTERAEWEVATIADGLSDGGPSKKHR